VVDYRSIDLVIEELAAIATEATTT